MLGGGTRSALASVQVAFLIGSGRPIDGTPRCRSTSQSLLGNAKEELEEAGRPMGLPGRMFSTRW